MRHRVASHQFNRDTKQRKALLRGLVRSLFETGSITTTKAKAKETQRLADKLLAKAQQPTLASRRTLHRFFGKRDVVNTVVDVIAPQYQGVNSGFTSLQVLGVRRGDNAELAKVSLIKMPETVGFTKLATKSTETKETESKETKQTAKQQATATKAKATTSNSSARTKAKGKKATTSKTVK